MISFELFNTTPTVEVQDAEYKRLLGYPKSRVIEGRAQELVLWAREWYQVHGRPWMYIRQTDIHISDGTIDIEGTVLSTETLSERMRQAQASSAMLVAVSAGRECEETARALWDEGKPDEYFFLEIYGTAVVEQLVAAASFRLCEWADQHKLAVLPHYSPGYPGWDIADQVVLSKLIIERQESPIRERIGVMDTGMLKPKKSLLAIFGITEHTELIPRLTAMIPCENCSLPGCRYRRTPKKYALPRLETIRSLQSN